MTTHPTKTKLPNPIKGVRRMDGLTFEVDSRSGPHPHHVNLMDYQGGGSCDCPHFQFNLEPKLRDGWHPAENLRCHHIKRARAWTLEEFLPKLAEVLHDQDYSQTY